MSELAVETTCSEIGSAPRPQLTPGTWYARWGKRWFDCTGATFLLLLVGWTFPLWALAIKLASRGKVMFNQPRIGKDGAVFVMYKFRTLCWEFDPNHPGEAPVCHRTRLGKLMRRYRIDELPQLFNVLKGEMSLIGPRPILAEEYARLSDLNPDYRQRVLIVGGISGLAQVSLGRPGSIEQEHLRYQADLRYVQSVSLLRDLFISVRTVWVICTGFGAV